jgi:transposase
MAIQGRAIYDESSTGRGPRAPDDFMATGTIASKKRRGPRARTSEERRKRRYIYWLGLVRSGMTLREIEADSGFGRETIREGVAWAVLHGEAWLRSQIQEGRSAG